MKKILITLLLSLFICAPAYSSRNIEFKTDEEGRIISVEYKESQLEKDYKKFDKFADQYPWLFTYWSDNGKCLIKGNISYTTGEKIYHIPGWKDYDNTVIDTDYGEKWFCTEYDAYIAGWRAPYYSGRPSYYPDWHDIQ